MRLEASAATRAGLVSIVVPCYNSRHFLAETLESAFAQSYPYTEVIVIDDGSTDGTAELIRSYANRVTAEFGPNRGVSAARNRGTVLARGEFIQYLDADDVMPPAAIAARVSALQRSGADVAYSDWERLVETEPGAFVVGARIARRIEDVSLDIETALITSFWAPPAALTYRRTIVEKIGGWKDWLPIIQDARFLQDAGLAGGRFIYSPGVGARYREHCGTSLSRRSEAAFTADVFRNACDLQKIFEARGGASAEQRRALAKIYDGAARSLFFHDKEAFRDCLVRLHAIDPDFRTKWTQTANLASAILGFKAGGALMTLLMQLRRASSKLRCRADI
jgi:glycosyltransferase involved in cell wall biosynthesis